MSILQPFRVTESLHPLDACPSCADAAHAAEVHASVTGSVGATWKESDGDTVRHSATVSRQAEPPRISVPARVKSPAEEARAQADATGNALIEALASALPVMDPKVAAELDRLLAQLRADEYESGWEAGRAQHPANRRS